MSETTLNVSRKTVKDFLSTLKNGRFIIPDYQRPYKWDIEKCETLWNDIKLFTNEIKPENNEYFLGTIVSCINEKNLEIIDGQQRITTLMLLLRAFYTQLEEMNCQGVDEKQKIDGLKSQIEACLWDVDEYSGRANDKEKIKILSEVATDNDNEIFHHIMKTGECSDSNDNYTKNYNFFLDSCYSYASKEPLSWFKLCLTILNNCIILPINCNNQDTALTIFSTLNDRGLPLSDSDIFKAKMYKSSENRELFIKKWKDFSEICESAELSINDIFRYYSHVIRANNGCTDKEIALRKFYLDPQKNYLINVNLLDDLVNLAEFWRYMKEGEKKISLECRKYIQCLENYPNEYWKYVVSVFFFTKKEYSNKEFLSLLKKLVAFLFLKFIENPTVNAIKTDIFKYCVFICGGEKGEDLKLSNRDEIYKRIDKYGNSKLTKSLLLLHSYLNAKDNQEDLIQSNFHIEHIFPRKWQGTNYNGWAEKEAEDYLERLGNKIPFESRLNILAGNGYFGKKKEKYSSSNIYEVKQLSQYSKSDWNKEDIEKREGEMIKLLKDFFNKNL